MRGLQAHAYGMCLALVAALAANASADVIARCGFEPSGDNWSFTCSGGGVFNSDQGLSDSPTGQRSLAAAAPGS